MNNSAAITTPPTDAVRSATPRAQPDKRRVRAMTSSTGTGWSRSTTGSSKPSNRALRRSRRSSSAAATPSSMASRHAWVPRPG